LEDRQSLRNKSSFWNIKKNVCRAEAFSGDRNILRKTGRASEGGKTSGRQKQSSGRQNEPSGQQTIFGRNKPPLEDVNRIWIKNSFWKTEGCHGRPRVSGRGKQSLEGRMRLRTVQTAFGRH
jgi:hypothetical protein